jgi:trehalose 6-phosphate synthase
MNAAELGKRAGQVTAGAKVIIVSNRQPYSHERTAHGIRAVRPASGMTVALDPIVRAVGGTWIAHGSGSADRLAVDERDRVRLPPEDPKFTLRRVWLTPGEVGGYYNGLANGALWPLCHIVYTRPHFSRADWEVYRSVNRRFRDAVLEEAGGEPAFVFIQDYHLALLPRLVKDALPDARVVQFWHIPWPNREVFRVFPWGEELLDGLLGNDLLGFHIQYHCNNFLDTIERSIESMVDTERFRVLRGGKPTYVRPFPISVDFEQIGKDAHSEIVRERRQAFLGEIDGDLSGLKLFVGADRIDYTKGIPERLRAFDLLLERFPDLKGKVMLLQLAAPSRTSVEAYRRLNDELDGLVGAINRRHRTGTWAPVRLLRSLAGRGAPGRSGRDWTPVRFLRAAHDYYAVLAAYLMADVAIVTSLHDGMNLVAKEFLAARTDGDGVLILSPFTGAARELPDALQVNPYDIDRLADTMYEAYAMPEADRRSRMERMRTQVEKNNVYNWGGKILDEVERILTEESL